MKALILSLLSFGFVAGVLAAGPDLPPAAGVTWNGQFGASSVNPATVYCLMGRGFFQMSTSAEMPNAIESWQREHPKAVLVSIATIQPVVEKAPESKLTYVWVVDGDSNLNIELVRQGCFAPETQALPRGKKPDVGEKEYESFVKKLVVAAQFATEHKLGIWKDAK
ncbi:MAG TPA: hypothetical protein VJS88_04020 [Chthoniobacterales bacterium]|nr:hypothetical protein [Chthoniobacterales bacterium]